MLWRLHDVTLTSSASKKRARRGKPRSWTLRRTIRNLVNPKLHDRLSGSSKTLERLTSSFHRSSADFETPRNVLQILGSILILQIPSNSKYTAYFDGESRDTTLYRLLSFAKDAVCSPLPRNGCLGLRKDCFKNYLMFGHVNVSLPALDLSLNFNKQFSNYAACLPANRTAR